MNNLPPPPPPEFLTFQERVARDIQRETQQLREMPINLPPQPPEPVFLTFQERHARDILDDTLVKCFKDLGLIDEDENANERNEEDLKIFMEELKLKLDALSINEVLRLYSRNRQSTPPKLQLLAENEIRKPSNDTIFNTPDNRALLNEIFERLPNVEPYAIGQNVLRSKTNLKNYIKILKKKIDNLFKGRRDSKYTHLVTYKYTPSYIKCKTNGNKTQVAIGLQEPIGDSNNFHERIILDDIKISSNFLKDMLDNIEGYLQVVYDMLDDLDHEYDGGKKKSKNKSKKKKKSRKTKRKMNKKSQKRKK